MNKEKLIEKYFSNQLSDEEFGQLKKLIEEDEAFKSEFYHQLEIQKTIAEEKNNPIKERLKKLDNKPKKKNTWYLYAAAITILIAIGFLFYNPSSDLQEAYAENFEVYPNTVAPTVRDANTSKNAIQKAFNYYDNQNYKKAITAFEELYTTEKAGYANFYYAVSLMADNQVEKAVTALENSNWKIPEKYQVQTDWYLALCYLKLENKEKAINSLRKVREADGAMSVQAQEILSEIK